jgi:long-chain acyl-CoA synthetase
MKVNSLAAGDGALFHATGLFSGFLLPCAVGQKVVLLRKWDAVTAMRTIQNEKVTMARRCHG